MLGTIGDLVEDVVVHLGGPINLASDTTAAVTRRPGGSAANVAVAAVRAGGRARFIGQVGDDSTGTMLVEAMRREGVELMVRRAGCSGTIVVLVDETGERTMLSDRGTCTQLRGTEPAWLDGLHTLHVPIYSLTVEPLGATTSELIARAHERGITVSIDASSASVLAAYGVERIGELLAELRPAVLLCNADEAACLGPIANPTWPGAQLTIIKRGPAPALVLAPGAMTIEVPVPAIGEVTDTTGAGDAFAAGYLLARAQGAGTFAAVVAGHRCARQAISRAAAVPGRAATRH